MRDEIVLAIETSQCDGGVALYDGEAVHVELLTTRTRHDDDLMPAIARVFERAARSPGDLDAVGASIGPGGFTGLRIAVSTVKMLALVTGCRVVAVPTALVVAEGSASEEIGTGPIVVVLAVKGENFWVSRLVMERDAWREDGPAGLAEAETLSFDGVTTLVADEHLPSAARERCADAGVRIVAPRFDPRACLTVARRELIDGNTTDAFTLGPIYPREPEAVRLWDLRDGGGGRSSNNR